MMLVYIMSALTALIVITIHVRHVGGEAIVDYKHEDCRYHVHFHPLSWSEAYNVCKGKNQTLLKLDDLAEHSKIHSIVDSKINKVLNSSLDLVWIGLQATSQGGNLHHFWPDCGQLTSYTDFNPWQNSSEDQKEGCVMFHPSSTYYSAVDCSSSLPYICENSETDPLQCFFPETNAAVRNSFSSTVSNHQNQPACAKKYHKGGINDGPCAGVMHNGVNCKFLKLVSVNPPSSQNERDTLYLDTVIDWIQYTSIASSVPPSDACSMTSHSSLLTTSTALYASSESLITSAESTLTTLYPSTTLPFPSSTATLGTPHLQTVTGSIHSSPVMSSLSSSSSVYYCSWVSNVTYTPQELQQKIEKMKSELTVDKKQTNKYKRSLISVSDSRPSARGIGSSVGVLTLGIVITLLVAFDCPRASRHTLKMVRIAKARFTKSQP
nr:uncharacterized protein LOC105329529 [Crassostrea gigas]